MIPVAVPAPENEPPHFNANCREPGHEWLAANPTKDPHDQSEWWRQFQPDLAKHFNYRCGWEATWIGLAGIVEHWLSCGPRKGVASPHRHLAFEWSNYRYANGVVNSRKGILDDQVLDPCEVQDGWFVVHLPSFQLLPTDNIPAGLKDKAKLTLDVLQLRRGHQARWTRWDWYRRYWNNGTPDLVNLSRDAPLVAAAVEAAQLAGRALPNPDDCLPAHAIVARKRRYRPRIRN